MYTTISEHLINNPISSLLSPGIFKYNQQRAFRFLFEITCEHIYCLKKPPLSKQKGFVGSKFCDLYSLFSVSIFLLLSYSSWPYLYMFCPRLTSRVITRKRFICHFVHFFVVVILLSIHHLTMSTFFLSPFSDA